MIFNGWGVPKDEHRAQMFYRNAVESYKPLADKGDINAKYELANLYLKIRGKEKLSETKRIFESVVEGYKNTTDVKAKIRLGLMYAKGLGVRKNLSNAKKIVDEIRTKIEDSELVELCMLAGNIDDALKYHAKAIQLWQIAAEKGNDQATFELARLLSNAELFGSEFTD